MTTSYDVIIVGGGPVGLACARELGLSGRKVVVLERPGEQGEAWRAAAGMLAAQVEAAEDDPLFDLAVTGRERYVELAPLLLERTGVDIGFWQPGIARVAADEDDADDLRSRVAWQRQQGHLCDWFDPAEVRRRWPWLGPTHGALWASREAAIHPARLVEALQRDAVAAGAKIVRDPVRQVDRRGDRVVGVAAGERYSGPDVVIAAGAWSRNIAGIPRPLSVEPIRGQMASLAWPAGLPPSIIVGKSCYLVARDGEALAGTTMEHAGYDPEVTPAGLAGIFTGVSALCPALATGEVLRTWAGLRPVTPDGRPIVGREPRAEGLWYATGHGRNGILLAAITGQVITRLISGETEIDHLAAMSPDRFWRW